MSRRARRLEREEGLLAGEGGFGGGEREGIEGGREMGTGGRREIPVCD